MSRPRIPAPAILILEPKKAKSSPMRQFLRQFFVFLRQNCHIQSIFSGDFGHFLLFTPPKLELLQALANRIPGATYQTMAGLGHFPMSENPKRFLRLIRLVLQDLIARSPRPAAS